jgi:hypothetical protein
MFRLPYSIALFSKMSTEIYDTYVKDIPPLPDTWATLQFGGHMTIDEFRAPGSERGDIEFNNRSFESTFIYETSSGKHSEGQTMDDEGNAACPD